MSYYNSYTRGEINSPSLYACGIAAVWQYGNMQNCYTTMNIAGDESSYVRLFYYINHVTDVINCFTLLNNSIEEMKTQSTYTDAEWDFDTIWEMDSETGYPKLQWEKNIK